MDWRQRYETGPDRDQAPGEDSRVAELAGKAAAHEAGKGGYSSCSAQGGSDTTEAEAH